MLEKVLSPPITRSIPSIQMQYHSPRELETLGEKVGSRTEAINIQDESKVLIAPQSKESLEKEMIEACQMITGASNRASNGQNKE